MKDLLNEIKQLTKTGYETAILANEEKSKDIFFNILLKIEIALKSTPPVHTITPSGTDRTYEKLDEETKRQAYLIAYCFSYYEHSSLYPQYTQDKAFDVAAKKLNIKKTTLKNYRDAFDGHNNNSRAGYYQKPLPSDMEQFKHAHETKSQSEIISAAKAVLGIK
ncbi:MAG: hypothetical protein K2M34_05165 [Alphaproteobacteria bacterium]|nr:hypothetical protein [Alphaproteobacteria bacterium]